MRNNIASYPHILMKLNQSLLLLNTTQSPSSSPDNNENFINKILMQLNEWLAFFPNLINSLIAKFEDTFTNFFEKFKDAFTNFFQTLGHWLVVAVTYLIEGVGIILLCSVLLLYLPVIVRCFAWLVFGCLTVISEVIMLMWPIFTLLWRSLFEMCCVCGRNCLMMMKASGTAARAVFAYFSNLLRAGLALFKCLMSKIVSTVKGGCGCGQANGVASSSAESDIITDRQKMKETDEYKRAIEEELAARQQQLLHPMKMKMKMKIKMKIKMTMKMKMTMKI